MKLDRRDFLKATAGGMLFLPGMSWGKARRAKPRIAAIVTEYRKTSHADVILTRMLGGYTFNIQESVYPRTQIVSMYLDQVPETDIGRGLAKSYGVQLSESIEDAILMGGEKLAVDGVVIIGEHGTYPHNEKGQHMYPRRRFFEETVNAFKKGGGVAPVFNDKHLGYAWEDAKWMYDQAREMGFPLMAGSSVPTGWRKPDLEYPLDVELEEGLGLGYGDTEAYGFHALESLQCMIERRKGGESGVKAVTHLAGEKVWDAAKAGKWSRSLMEAVTSCVEGRPKGTAEEHCKSPELFLIEHTDGFRSSVLMLNGYTAAFGFAGKRKGIDKPDGSHFWLQEPDYGHFGYLAYNIETMMIEGREQYPPERTLLTTGVLDAVMTSKHEGGRRVETPWLERVAYRTVDKPGRRAMFP
ncbi:MAG: hypothetical protein KDA68_00225 [Planctomycetaceae bacterium]|nr:hypothetical protein [Planctomycetaceae bacterium]